MRRLILIIISVFALWGSPALAKDPGSAVWIVTQLSGDARLVHPGLQPVALKATARLEPGDTVVTGLTGRATLTRGADYIIVAPRSELRLPATPQPTGFTRIVQNLGTMLFKVQHTGVPHFAVETPMLAAVVKGTTFTVIVDKDRSAVQVIQGAVQVTANEGGMSRIVEGGKTVFVNHADPKRLIDADQRSPATTTSSSTTGVKLSGSQTPSVAAITNLTGGLVRPSAASSTNAAVAPTSTPVAGSVAPTALTPVVSVVNTTVPIVTQPVAGIVDTTVPGVTDTVTNVIDTTVPGVTDTVTNVIDTTVPGVTDTVTNVIDTTVPGVTDTVVNVIDTTVPGVTDTVTNVIDTTVSGVTDTVTDVVGGLLGNSGPGSTSSSGTDSGLIGGLLGGLSPH